MLPGPDCPFPRKVQVPGDCCEKWVCDAQDELRALGGFAMAGKLLDAQLKTAFIAWLIRYQFYCVCVWILAYRQEETLGFDPSMECMEHMTEWSACSRSCGMGVSTRVTNQNRRCEMMKQSRLCMVRPCPALTEQAEARVRENQVGEITALNCTFFPFKLEHLGY